MVSQTFRFSLESHPNEIIDITEQAKHFSYKSRIKDGILCIFLSGSTGGITTVEYEPGLIRTDIPKTLQKLFPEGPNYAHHQTWGDHNGHSHLRSFFVKPSLTVPLVEGRLALGTWQQIVFCEFDERPRHREIICQIVG